MPEEMEERQLQPYPEVEVEEADSSHRQLTSKMVTRAAGRSWDGGRGEGSILIEHSLETLHGRAGSQPDCVLTGSDWCRQTSIPGQGVMQGEPNKGQR